MKRILLLLLLAAPALLHAQEFVFVPEYDTIPVQMNGWQLPCPFMGGITQSSPALADLTSDGDLDLFVGDFVGTIFYFENTGTFQQPQFAWPASQFDSLRTINSAFQPTPEFADLDNDGDLECVIGSGYVT